MRKQGSNTVPSEHWPRQLADGLGNMGIVLSPTQQQTLLDYLALLCKWNSAYNLTAVRDPHQVVSRQLLDSLSILPWIRGPRILDVGTGAGLPGIPLAIALPDEQFLLLDSNGKKTRFVRQAILELGLENVRVDQQRVEAMRDPHGFDTITSRAFTDLHRMLDLTRHLHAHGGRWAAMKASLQELSTQPLPPGLAREVIPLSVPGSEGVRHLVMIQDR